MSVEIARRAVPSRCGSRRGPRPTSDGNRRTETSGHGADGRDGLPERCVPHRSVPVQSTSHAHAYADRVIGSIRRECLDHVIVVSETGLRHLLTWYVTYYQRWRTHLALAKDSPMHRPVAPPARGSVVAIPQVGGLHHRYERRAASPARVASATPVRPRSLRTHILIPTT